MLKRKLHLSPWLFCLVLVALLLSSCASSRQASPALRTPDFCNTAEGKTIPKTPKKATVRPAPGTPVGGNYSDRRR